MLPGAKAPKVLDCSDAGAVFTNVHFSARGKYVLFDEKFDTPQGWHVINAHIEEVATQKSIDVLLDNTNYMDVVLDDTRAVGCGVPADSSTGYVRIFSLPDGKLLTWEILEGKNPGCRYDAATQSVIWSDFQGQRQSLDVNTGKRLP